MFCDSGQKILCVSRLAKSIFLVKRSPNETGTQPPLAAASYELQCGLLKSSKS